MRCEPVVILIASYTGLCKSAEPEPCALISGITCPASPVGQFFTFSLSIVFLSFSMKYQALLSGAAVLRSASGELLGNYVLIAKKATANTLAKPRLRITPICKMKSRGQLPDW